MDFVRWVFGFLWFHRRLIVGGILIAGLIYFLFYGKDLMPKLSFSSHRADLILSDDDSEPDSDIETAQPDVDSVPLSEQQLEDFLSGSSINELVAESTRLDLLWPRKVHSEAYIMVIKIKQIAEHLLSLDLTPTQQRFAETSLIRALSILDSINQQGKLGIPDVREEMVSKVSPFLDHPDTDVRSMAHLAMAVYPSYDFLVDPSEEGLQKAEEAFNRHFDEATESVAGARKLAEMVYRLRGSGAMPQRVGEFAMRALERFKQDTSPEGIETASRLEEQLFFGPLNLDSIVDRVERNDLGVDDDVARLGQALREVPTARIEIYQVALDVIRTLIQKGKRDRALEFMTFLNSDVLPKLENDEKRQKIQDAIDEFKPFL